MSSSFHIASYNFVGPIELLLQLIRKKKLHINEVGLAAVADSFLEHFRSMPDMTLHHATHFLGVAATLVYVKSKALSPEISTDDESEAALEELVDRMQLFALVGQQIPELVERKNHYMTRLPTTIPVDEFVTDSKVTPYIFYNYIENILKSNRELTQRVRTHAIRKIKPRIALSMMMERVKNHITNFTGQISLRHIVQQVYYEVSDSHDMKDASITGFLATLEMVKQQNVVCQQPTIFSDITISRYQITSE